MALGSALFGAFASGLYVTLEGGSATDVAWAAAYGFGAGFVTGLAAGSIMAALGYAAAAGAGAGSAYAAEIGYSMGGFIVSSAALPLAVNEVMTAYKNGDRIDQGFALAALGLSVTGVVRTQLSVWHLTNRGGPVSRAAAAWQAASRQYKPDYNWYDTKAFKGNIVVGPISSENGGKVGPFFTTIETLQGENGLVNQMTLASRLQSAISQAYGPRKYMGVYEFVEGTTISRGIPRVNPGTGGYPQFCLENADSVLRLIDVIPIPP